MDFDLFFVLGLCLSALSIPAVLSAISNSHPPRLAAVTLIIGGGMVVYAVMQNPGAYNVAGTPEVFINVIGRLVN